MIVVIDLVCLNGQKSMKIRGICEEGYTAFEYGLGLHQFRALMVCGYKACETGRMQFR